MAKCYRCALAMANLSLWITVIASIVALFAPFWLTAGTGKSEVTQGLFMTCDNPFGDNAECEWFDTDSEVETWFTACQGLWAAGAGVMFLMAIFSFFLCCESCQKPPCATLIALGTFLAASALITSVILFGVKFSELLDGNLFDRGELVHFDWGYYIAIVAAGFSIITCILLIMTLCCMRQ